MHAYVHAYAYVYVDVDVHSYKHTYRDIRVQMLGPEMPSRSAQALLGAVSQACQVLMSRAVLATVLRTDQSDSSEQFSKEPECHFSSKRGSRSIICKPCIDLLK